ncbi:MAG: helicase C-terminal domain-containing protein, partial [Nanoarchaeota archaeon]
AQLNDIFAGTVTKAITKHIRENNESCDNDQLPCKIELKEKNFSVIKEYLKKNPALKLTDFFSIQDVTRMSVASVCPYWSPIVPKEYDLHFDGAQKILYRGLDGIDFIIHQRKKGCPYYEQYEAYTDADVIIFNSLKYKLETLMNRKPLTELEIIDECDEFLDSFATQERVSINRLLGALAIIPDHAAIKELIDITNTVKRKYNPGEEIYPVARSLIEQLLKTMLGSKELLYELAVDEHSYAFHLEEVAQLFADFMNESYFSIEKNEEDIIINIVTTNLKKRFAEMAAKNKIMIFMSGTLHSPDVLRTIFGIERSIVIEAETKQQGELLVCKHGSELDCKYANFQSQYITREDYLQVFSKTIACAKKPALVHLTSFSDLPDDKEKYMYELDNLPTQNEIINEQIADPLGEKIRAFKNKEFDVLFTTKCSRGIDFPGDSCNSIVISRFPYPNISALFWKILKKTHPQHFMQFYMDKARRELLQKIYRGLRSKNDRVYLLSPDSRVLDFKMG